MPAVHSICIASAYYPPHMGGVEVFTQSIARELVSRGLRVTVVTNGIDETGITEDSDGVEVFRMPAKDPTGRMPLLDRGVAAKQLWSILEDRAFDAYVVNTRFYPLSLRMLSLAHRKGVQPILIEHGSAYLTLGNPALDLGIRGYEDAIGAKIRTCDPACYGVSREAGAWMANFGLAAKGTIHNSIDVPAFCEMSSDRDYRAEFNIPNDAMLVAFTGRLIVEKGIWTLAEIARVLDREGFYFFVAGDGPEFQKLSACKPGNMKLLGRLDRADVSALLKQADVFCFPSAYPEGLPTSLLEAAACEDFIVTASVAGAAEIVPSPDYGTVLDEVSVDSFVAALRDARADSQKRHEIASRCKRYVAEEFCWSKAADDLLAACAGEGR